MSNRPTMIAAVADGSAHPTAQEHRLTQWCAATACGIALVAAAGWVLDLRFLAGQWGTYLPMPPFAALGVFLLGGGIFSQARWPSRYWGRCVALAGASLAALLGLLVLVEFVSGYDSGVEGALARTGEMVGQAAMGQMSPVAAAALLLESAALVLMLQLTRWRVAASLAALLALLATGINLVVLVGYSYGAPLLYGGPIRPVALPAAFALVLLGAGQVHLLLPSIPALHAWRRGTTRGLLVRAFLPAMFLLIILEGWTDALVKGSFRFVHPAVSDLLITLAGAGLVVVVISWTARRTADASERAETALRESEEQYRLAVNATNDGMWDVNLRDGTVRFNGPYVAAFGAPSEDEEAWAWWTDHVHPDDRDRTLSSFNAAVDGSGDVWKCEYRFRRIDGTWANTSDRAHITRDSTGKAQYVIGALSDLTESKQSEAALVASELRYRRLFESAKDGILILDAETGMVVDVNPFLVELLGFSRESFFGKTVWDLGFFKDIIANQDSFAELQREKYVRYENKPLEACDGRRIDVEFVSNVYLVKDHKVIECNVRDITERKRAHEALQQSEARFKDIFDDAPIGYHELDAEGRVIRVNRTELEMLGYGVEEMLGRHVWEFVEGREYSRQAVADKLSGTVALQSSFERIYSKKDGTRIPVLIQERLVRGNDGKITGIRTTVQDITERKRAEGEKATLEAQLHQAQKMESVGRLAGGVAHDFNNMLGVILGHAELALAQVDPAQPLHADLQQIHTAANRSADLTRQLLAFARKQTVAPKVLDLNETVAGMLKMLHRLIGENIDLTWEPTANLWPVKVDPSQIDQILANLCVNARDAIAGVGSLAIETGNSTLDEHYCAAHAGCVPGEYVRLTVSDDGGGMDQETVAHIFEPFFTTKVMSKGTGLGLATVYGIVKQNNGFINVYSEPNHGTTFTIYLPRYMGKTGQAQTKSAARPVLRGHETILLVEDEPSILTLTKRMLENQGYTVLAASTPGEAIRLAKEHSGEIHLLMTDVVMPEMNGRVLAENLLSVYPLVKRLFMSGYTADVIAHQGVLDEGVHFIQKPFSTEDLATKVRDALDAPS